MSKENDIKEQLILLGVYSPAFDPEIHTLCVMERELSRAMKAWKATATDKSAAPSIADPLFDSISKLRRDILQHRDALGLTPKALQRLRRQAAPQENNEAVVGTASPAFSALMDRIQEATNGSA